MSAGMVTTPQGCGGCCALSVADVRAMIAKLDTVSTCPDLEIPRWTPIGPAPASCTPHSEVGSSAATQTAPPSADLTAGLQRIEAGKARADAEIAAWPLTDWRSLADLFNQAPAQERRQLSLQWLTFGYPGFALRVLCGKVTDANLAAVYASYIARPACPHCGTRASGPA